MNFQAALIQKMMKYIESANNQQLKQLAKLLQNAKERRNTGKCVLEGVHLLQAFAAAGRTVQQIFVPQSRLYTPEVQQLLANIPEQKYTLVSDNILSKISNLNNADDVMTLIEMPVFDQCPEYGDCVVLDEVQDPSNVGTILRSVAAAGIQNVILGKGCADAYSPKVLRSAMGAHFILNIIERIDLQQWIHHYQGQILATALRKENNFSLYELDLLPPAAWILGNEGSGVSDYLLDRATATVQIPMLGATESLNVAMATTVCLFEQMRQRCHSVLKKD